MGEANVIRPVFPASGQDDASFSTDALLIQQVEETVDAANAHYAASLIGMYRSVVSLYKLTGDDMFFEVVVECECALRTLLTKARLQKYAWNPRLVDQAMPPGYPSRFGIRHFGQMRNYSNEDNS